MKTIRKSKWLTGVLLAAAIAMTIFSGVQGSRAALNYVSDNYVASMNLDVVLSATLTENGTDAGKLLKSLPVSYTDFEAGKAYNEVLRVKNDGNVDEYVRVILRRYWSYADGTKCQELDPALVELAMGNGWLIDESASTDERLVLYWPTILPAGESTAPLCSTLTLNGSRDWMLLNTTRTVENDYIIYETISPYNGCYFTIEAEVEGVQTHNVADAIKSAWGVTVNVAKDGSIALD